MLLASLPLSCNVCFWLPHICLDNLLLLLDGYTFFSVSQERIMDELDQEAKRARMQGPKTGANWDVCLSCTTKKGLMWTLLPLIHIPRLAAVFETALDFVLSWLCGSAADLKLDVSWFACLSGERSTDLNMTLHAAPKDPDCNYYLYLINFHPVQSDHLL